MSTELYKAAAQRPSDQLERLLHMVDRRLDYHRARALALSRILRCSRNRIGAQSVLLRSRSQTRNTAVMTSTPRPKTLTFIHRFSRSLRCELSIAKQPPPGRQLGWTVC
jgi:hypothetical protein